MEHFKGKRIGMKVKRLKMSNINIIAMVAITLLIKRNYNRNSFISIISQSVRGTELNNKEKFVSPKFMLSMKN